MSGNKKSVLKSKEKTIEEKYQKKTQREHILERPDSYVGSLEICQEMMWVYDNDSDMIVEKLINYSPAFYKIYDEVLVNAADHSKIHEDCNKFEISIDRETNRITVKNNGPGIEVVEHKEHKVYVPTLIFGHLLTGTNFDDENDQRTTGGRNGYGSKLCNIYSTEFEVETFDAVRMKKFKQKFSDNMSIEHKPIITDLKKGSGYTQISFIPDLARFGLTTITDDIYSLFVKRAYDLAGVCPKIVVHIDSKKVKFPSFKHYIDKFKLVAEEEGSLNINVDFSSLIYHDQDRWQIGMIFTPDQNFKQVSYVNSICTYHGGTHTNYIVDAIVDIIKAAIAKKDKKIVVKPQTIKDNIIVFINSTIVNPAFNTQTKDSLKTTSKSFGSKCELPAKFIKSICSSGIVDYVLNVVQRKDQAKIGKKTKKSSKTSLNDIIKLEDANKAGTNESVYCSLILTEGDSAKALAMSGLTAVDSDYYGVFPLKGKPMNVREHSSTAVFKNEEIINICRILGLTPGQTSTSKNRRYGRIIIMADQDTDGFHIKGLLLNFFHFYWPELLQNDGFVSTFNTPIVKARKNKKEISFFNMIDFLKWKETAESTWTIKYYKGLGTSTNEEAKDYFRNLDTLVKWIVPEHVDDLDNIDKSDKLIMNKVKKVTKKTKKVVSNDENYDEDEDVDEELNSDNDNTIINKKYSNPNTEAITLAFEKNRACDRKVWVREIMSTGLDYNSPTVSIPDFINCELRLFSKDDCERSLPGLDGFKICQRKIIHTVMKNKLFTSKNEQKVGQLANLTSSETDYHHGEKSLCEAIVGLAQNYVGSNNLNLLDPDGQFGSRLDNGKDHASERYTYTKMSKLGQLLFKEVDNNVLEFIVDDGGREIEPKLFAPILPPLLLNGSSGIGTGYSAEWSSYNPKDIINIFKSFLTGEETNYDILPWFRGFNGTVLKANSPRTFIVYGKYQIIDHCTIRITELPLGSKQAKSYNAYKIFLEKLRTSGVIIDHDSNLKVEPAVFTITMDESALTKLRENKEIYSTFALMCKINTSNMNAHNVSGVLQTYNTIEDYINDFYYMRYDVYSKRKEFLIKKLTKELDMLKWKVQFIDHYLDGTIEIGNKRKLDIIASLENLNYPKFVTGKVDKNDDDDEEKEEEKDKGTYDYVLSMKLWNLSQENIEKLRLMLLNKKEELNKIESTSEEEQWLREIVEFEQAYDNWLIEKPEEIEKISSVQSKIVKKTKKIKKIIKK